MLTDQNPFAQLRSPMDMMRHGWASSLFHAEAAETAEAIIRDRGITYLVLCSDSFAADGPFARRMRGVDRAGAEHDARRQVL